MLNDWFRIRLFSRKNLLILALNTVLVPIVSDLLLPSDTILNQLLGHQIRWFMVETLLVSNVIKALLFDWNKLRKRFTKDWLRSFEMSTVESKKIINRKRHCNPKHFIINTIITVWPLVIRPEVSVISYNLYGLYNIHQSKQVVGYSVSYGRNRTGTKKVLFKQCWEKHILNRSSLNPIINLSFWF